jgi:hypothetical protein
MHWAMVIRYLFQPEDTTVSEHRAGIYFVLPDENPPWGYVKCGLWLVVAVLIGLLSNCLR